MFVAAQTWNTTCIPSHDRLWVNTHTTFLALILGQERSDLFLLVLFTFDDTLNSLVVCVLAIFLQCSSTLSWTAQSYSYRPRPDDLFHAISCRSNPFPTHSIPLLNTLFSLSCCSYFCIPHKMFLHFRKLLENGSLQRSPHKMFLHFMERLPHVCGLQCLQCLIVFAVFNVLNVFNVSSVSLSFWS